jgi:hypothetical protein
LGTTTAAPWALKAGATKDWSDLSSIAPVATVDEDEDGRIGLRRRKDVQRLATPVP